MSLRWTLPRYKHAVRFVTSTRPASCHVQRVWPPLWFGPDCASTTYLNDARILFAAQSSWNKQISVTAVCGFYADSTSPSLLDPHDVSKEAG